MIYLMIFYVYLAIHRPMEIWQALGDMRPELIYFTLLSLAWVVAAKRVRSPALLFAIGGMATAFLFSWAMSPWAEKAEFVVKNYTFVVVFALIMATAVRDERALYKLVAAFMVVMAIYMLHSVREYVGGRHVFRMGIARLVGVDTTLGDPNSFGASIVYSLPFLGFFWVHWGRGWKRGLIALYFLLAIGCVLLTGSRSSLLGVVVWGGMLLMQSRHKALAAVLLGVMACSSWFVLPESLKTRFETIIDPSVGPANAQESGMGRIQGVVNGVKLLGQYPLSGCGPGAWRPATGSPIESHSLYGQVMGEMGGVGIVTFGGLVIVLAMHLRRLKRFAHPGKGPVPDASLYHLGRAMSSSLFLLLFLGIFGHNLYRYNWAWYCAFTAVALGVCQDRIRCAAAAPTDDEATHGWDYSISPAAV
ncbi:MAG TPA: O-antigen ligase family protein [Gemmataceae bacterium]|nr:O-antigen ligase family protein [Gemmataceae bacterium]